MDDLIEMVLAAMLVFFIGGLAYGAILFVVAIFGVAFL